MPRPVLQIPVPIDEIPNNVVTLVIFKVTVKCNELRWNNFHFPISTPLLGLMAAGNLYKAPGLAWKTSGPRLSSNATESGGTASSTTTSFRSGCPPSWSTTSLPPPRNRLWRRAASGPGSAGARSAGKWFDESVLRERPDNVLATSRKRPVDVVVMGRPGSVPAMSWERLALKSYLTDGIEEKSGRGRVFWFFRAFLSHISRNTRRRWCFTNSRRLRRLAFCYLNSLIILGGAFGSWFLFTRISPYTSWLFSLFLLDWIDNIINGW